MCPFTKHSCKYFRFFHFAVKRLHNGLVLWQVLVQKGVSETEVDTATRQVFQEDDSVDKSRSTRHGISEPALERLYVKATKQWLRGQSPSLGNRKARIVRWLQYRGFSWGVTNIILRKLLSEYPP